MPNDQPSRDQTTLDFPRMGAETAALVAEVERLLELAAESKEEMGAVNWGDLGVHDVEYRLSMLNPSYGPTCCVMIEEASPDSGLAMWIWDRLDKQRFPNTYIECEW